MSTWHAQKTHTPLPSCGAGPVGVSVICRLSSSIITGGLGALGMLTATLLAESGVPVAALFLGIILGLRNVQCCLMNLLGGRRQT